MEKDIIDGKIGEVGAYDLEFKGGKLKFEVKVEKVGVEAGVLVAVGVTPLLAAIKKAIPGKIDDAILEVVEKALLEL